MIKYFLAILFFLITKDCLAAEFLVKAQNNWMIDADKTGWKVEQVEKAARQYVIGDIVQVFPDGKLSDYAHAGGKFYVVRVAGLSYEIALKYQQQQTEEVTINGEIQERLVKRRLYRIRAEDLPQQIQQKMKDTYVFNTNWATIKNYINNKVTTLNE